MQRSCFETCTQAHVYLPCGTHPNLSYRCHLPMHALHAWPSAPQGTQLQELTLAGVSPAEGAQEGAAALLRAVAASNCPLQLLDLRGVALQEKAVEALCVLLQAPHVPVVALRVDVAAKGGAERIAQVNELSFVLSRLCICIC